MTRSAVMRPALGACTLALSICTLGLAQSPAPQIYARQRQAQVVGPRPLASDLQHSCHFPPRPPARSSGPRRLLPLRSQLLLRFQPGLHQLCPRLLLAHRRLPLLAHCRRGVGWGGAVRQTVGLASRQQQLAGGPAGRRRRSTMLPPCAWAARAATGHRRRLQLPRWAGLTRLVEAGQPPPLARVALQRRAELLLHKACRGGGGWGTLCT